MCNDFYSYYTGVNSSPWTYNNSSGLPSGVKTEKEAIAEASKKANKNNESYYVYKAIKKISPKVDVTIEDLK